MSNRLVIDGPNNRAAIMINADPGDADANFADPSFINPLAHFGDWKWAGHPDVDYLGIVSVLTGTINLDISSSGWTVDSGESDSQGTIHPDIAHRTVRAHGRSYTPILHGFITINGADVPIAGDCLILCGAGYLNYNFYADGSNIYISGSRVIGAESYATLNVGYTIYVCNMGIDASGNLVRPPLNVGFDADGSLARVTCGRFDTNFGYFYKNANGQIPTYRGPSTDINIGSLPSNSHIHAIGLALRVNGYSQIANASHATTDDTGRTWPGNGSASASLVKLSAAMPSSAQAMDLDFSTGRIKFGGVLDTDRSMFLISNAILKKTITVPSRSISTGSPIDETLTFDLGAVHPNATDVLGLCTFLGRTRSIGGTCILGQQTLPMRADRYMIQAGKTGALAFVAFFYLNITGGHLVMTVKRKYPQALSSGSLTSFTITVNALVGAFDF